MAAPTSSLSWLAELNDRQREAVTHDGGPLLVVAGAGSGKTKTLAYRVAYLIATGVDPARILLLTFTRRAAEEMLKRAASVTQQGTAAIARTWGGTFHATANRLLRIYGEAAGLKPDFTVMDQSDAADLLNVVRHEQGFSKTAARFPRKETCLAIYSRSVNGEESLAEVLRRYFPWCSDWQDELKVLFREYVRRKQDRFVLDYDDLLLYWAQLLEDDTLATSMSDRFDHVLVDEYQDTNPLQARILHGMRKTNANVMVVGDDAQSIYGFRAATVRNMLDFPTLFPGSTVVKLEQNYRSAGAILETTNRVIAQAAERYSKNLWTDRAAGQKPKLVTCKDEDAQDEFVVRTVLEHREQGIPLRRQAVLFRAGHLSDSLELELTRRNIPFHKYGGLRFLEAAHIKDMLAFLRVAENPRDEISWFRVLQLLEGVGPMTATAAVRHVARNGYDLRSLAGFKPPPAAHTGFGGLAGLLADLTIEGAGGPASQIERTRRFYEPILQKRYENPVVRKRDLENLERAAAGYASRSQFLAELTLDPPTSTSDLAGPPLKDEDWLVLSTIHSAKGCEWDVVILIHAADGCLPSDMSTGSVAEIDEERRLTYVAMTRARDFLYVAWPLRYYHKGRGFTDRHTYAQLCRFFSDAVLRTCERVQVSGSRADDQAFTGKAKGDVMARVKSRWD